MARESAQSADVIKEIQERIRSMASIDHRVSDYLFWGPKNFSIEQIVDAYENWTKLVRKTDLPAGSVSNFKYQIYSLIRDQRNNHVIATFANDLWNPLGLRIKREMDQDAASEHRKELVAKVVHALPSQFKRLLSRRG